MSTNLREVRESKEVYGEAVIIANNTEEFIEAVKLLVFEKNNTSLENQRIKVAKANNKKVYVATNFLVNTSFLQKVGR